MTLNEKKFFISKNKITKNWLEKNGFRHYKVMSDANNGDVYTKRFSVWRYGTAAVIEAEIMLFEKSGEVRVNCFDYGSRAIYAAWNCRKYGESRVITEIDEKIENELHKLGIKTNDK